MVISAHPQQQTFKICYRHIIRMGRLEFSAKQEPQGKSKTKPRKGTERFKIWLRLHGTHSMRIKLASETDDPKILSKLAKANRTPVDDQHVVAEVARNPKTPVSLLSSLAEDRRYLVKQAVAENPSTPLHVLLRLARDGQSGVRLSIAERTECPAETIAQIIGTYPIEKEHPREFVPGGPRRGDNEGHYDEGWWEPDHYSDPDTSQPAKYEHAGGFDLLADLIKKHDRQKREAIIQGVGKYNKELAGELGYAVMRT